MDRVVSKCSVHISRWEWQQPLLHDPHSYNKYNFTSPRIDSCVFTRKEICVHNPYLWNALRKCIHHTPLNSSLSLYRHYIQTIKAYLESYKHHRKKISIIMRFLFRANWLVDGPKSTANYVDRGATVGPCVTPALVVFPDTNEKCLELTIQLIVGLVVEQTASPMG